MFYQQLGTSGHTSSLFRARRRWDCPRVAVMDILITRLLLGAVPFMRYTCPVCGFRMPDPAADFNICPSCGTEFGYDDTGKTHAQLRAQWLRGGAQWWSPQAPPPGWDGYEQLEMLFAIPSTPPPMSPQFQTLIDPPGNQSSGSIIYTGLENDRKPRVQVNNMGTAA